MFLAGFTISCGDGNPSQNVESRPKRSHTVTINNIEPRRDVAGEIIDAHDGCLQFFNGRFYLYGTAYGKTDGLTNNAFHVYSSPDLERWTLEGVLLKERPDSFYFRPYVVFNPNTRKYVLWYSWYPNQKEWSGRAGAAISDTPVGPFTIVNSNVQLASSNPGDGSLFVDDDGTGYYIYTAMDMGYAVRVERLTPDYLGSSGEISDVVATGGKHPCFSGETISTTPWSENFVQLVLRVPKRTLAFPLHLWAPLAGCQTSIVALEAARTCLRNQPPTNSPVRPKPQSYLHKKPGSQKFQCPEGQPLSGWQTCGDQLAMVSWGTISNTGVRL